MDPDLMHSSSNNLNIQQTIRILKDFLDLKMRQGILGQPVRRYHYLVLAVDLGFQEWRFDRPAGGFHYAIYESEIVFFDLSLLDLICQIFVGFIMLRHHHDARGVSVEAVDNSWSFLAANPA